MLDLVVHNVKRSVRGMPFHSRAAALLAVLR